MLRGPDADTDELATLPAQVSRNQVTVCQSTAYNVIEYVQVSSSGKDRMFKTVLLFSGEETPCVYGGGGSPQPWYRRDTI